MSKKRVLLISMVPPQNDGGVRIVMHRHLVERNPFELYVATTYESCNPALAWTQIRLPYPLHRVRKSRFGPRLRRWLADYENWILPLTTHRGLDECIREFKPDVILTLAETGVCHLAHRAARKHGIPLAAMFLDWFPIMEPHFGHGWARPYLSQRYRQLYRECDLAFCTSDGMQEVLGPHPNSHVIYPMPGQHRVPETIFPPKSDKFRIVYVGSVQNFYGRMICSLIEGIETTSDLEIIVVGPDADWPENILQRAKAKGIYLGFKPPEEAAQVLAGADALLVVMSFEPEHRRFMETSFTTKFLDYTAFGKPIILWGPDYCTPARVARRDGGALVVDTSQASEVLAACRKIAGDSFTHRNLVQQAKQLHCGLFSPERLQWVFESEIKKLID